MNDYTQQTESALSSLSHTVGAHIKQLDNILKKGSTVHAVKKRTPRTLKAPEGLIGSIESAFTGSRASSFNASKSSSGQVMADLASAISRAMSRDL